MTIVNDVILAENVWKIFGRTMALRNVSMKVPKSSIFLLMGPNGSGKSTLLKIVTGLIKPNRGKVEVFGTNPWKQRHKIFAYVGAMFEDHAPPDWASGKAYLEYKSKLKKTKDPEREALAVAKPFGVDTFWERPFSTYSSGMKRKLALADAFINDPALVILDDPTVALDKEARLALEEIIVNRAKQNKTCVIASHIITEFEHHATHLAFLNLGQTIITGKVEEVMDKMGIHQVTIKTNKPKKAAAILMEKRYAIRVCGNNITVEGSEGANEIVKLLENLGIKAEKEEPKANLWEMYTKALTSR